MIQLNEKEKAIHARAVQISHRYRKDEIDLIQVLQEVGRARLFIKLEQTSLFQYATKILRLSDATAGLFISVARKAVLVPELQQAIRKDELTVSVASKIVSTITPENAKDLIHFAKTHSCREIERKVAGLNPNAGKRDRVLAISETQVRVEMTISLEEYELLTRARDLESQRTGSVCSLKDGCVASVKEYLEKNDPLKKAERAETRKVSKKASREVFQNERGDTDSLRPNDGLCAGSEPRYLNTKGMAHRTDLFDSYKPEQRVPLNASEKHAVFRKTQGRCTYVDSAGNRCAQTHWLQIHHIRPVSEGGGNEIENLTHLCFQHHDLVHQMELPFEMYRASQGSAKLELKSPSRRYGFVVHSVRSIDLKSGVHS